MADTATDNPVTANDIYKGGRFIVRDGSETGEIVATVPADGESSSAVSVPYSGPTGTPVTLYFLYEPPAYDVTIDAAQAAQIRAAKAVVVRVGTRQGESAEEMDRYSIDLPRGQAELVQLVRQLNPKTVVWVESVGQVDIEAFRNPWNAPDGDAPDGEPWTCTTGCTVPSIIWANYNGQAQGQAFGRILFGKANPSGKLTYSWYSDILEIGHVNDYNLLPTDTTKGRTYLYTDAALSYPFGWGLSYSSFDYANMKVASPVIAGDDTLSVSVDVTNTSAVVGKEVVQLYVTAPGSDGIDRPKRQLKGFEKIALGPGATKTVTIDVPAEDLWFWDDEADTKTWDLGTWTLRIGGSSVSGIAGSFALTSAPSPKLGTVMTIPTGVVLNTAAPANTIDAGLSAARSDDGFFDLADRSTVKVAYTSSDASVATVDAGGTVSPAGAGIAEITAAVTVGGVTKSDSFPVVVYAGSFTSNLGDVDVTLFADQVRFADQTITPAQAAAGFQLPADMIVDDTATFAYRIAPMDVNTAGATVTADGEFTATDDGVARVTVVATSGDATYSRTATVRVQSAAPVDSAALADAINQASSPSLVAGAYTAASWSALQQAIAQASATFANTSATQAQIDAATAALAKARSGLVQRGNLTALNAIVGAAGALQAGAYTDDSWAPLAAALSAAKALQAAPAGTSQAQADAAASAISQAIAALTAKPATVDEAASARAALASIVAQLALASPDAYTEASWKSVDAALTAAKALLANPNAAAADLRSALQALSAGVAGLAVAEPKVAAPGTVKVAQRAVTLVKGKAIKLAAKDYAPAGPVAVTWKSSNTKVATVSSSGRIAAKKAGKATITVTGPSGKTTVAVTVVAKRPKAYKSTKVAASVPAAMKVGEIAYVSGTYSPAKATGIKVRYASSDSSVLAVASTGQLVAVKAGTATVTVKTQHVSKKYTVTVQ
jgi:uncharacterized protein YjdB